MGIKKGIESCICSQPFTLYSFPTERKDPDTRRRWIRLLNQKGEGTHTNWQPKRSSRVCSLHFPDGHPTLANKATGNRSHHRGFVQLACANRVRYNWAHRAYKEKKKGRFTSLLASTLTELGEGAESSVEVVKGCE